MRLDETRDDAHVGIHYMTVDQGRRATSRQAALQQLVLGFAPMIDHAIVLHDLGR
jgi:hypothetical protein